MSISRPNLRVGRALLVWYANFDLKLPIIYTSYSPPSDVGVLAQLLCLSTCWVSPLPAVDISDATSTTCSAVTWGAQLQSPEHQQQCNVPSYPCPDLGVYMPQKTWWASPIIGYLFCNWRFFITIPSLVSIVVEIQLQRNARYISLRKAFLYRVIFPIIVPNSLIHMKLGHTEQRRCLHKSNVHSSVAAFRIAGFAL